MLSLKGDMNMMHGIEFVDQNPIGKSTRSNPATYLKAFDEIRRLYADQQAALFDRHGRGAFEDRRSLSGRVRDQEPREGDQPAVKDRCGGDSGRKTKSRLVRRS